MTRDPGCWGRGGQSEAAAAARAGKNATANTEAAAAAKKGGYGQSADCGGEEPEVTDDDQAECVAGLSLCNSASVANFEDCANAMGTDLCKFRTDAACATLAACFAP